MGQPIRFRQAGKKLKSALQSLAEIGGADGEPIKFLACYQKGVRVGMIHELQKRTRRKPSGVKNASIDPARAVLGDSVPQRQMLPLLPLPQGED